jgi:DinB superfamily
MAHDDALRAQVARLLSWEDAHASFDTAVADLDPGLRGSRPTGLPYSPWQLVEHIRLTQADILDFCRNPAYQERDWPRDYWPQGAAPPTHGAWGESIEKFQKDRDALAALADDPAIRLHDAIPHGNGQTYLRELLLVADHTAYHVGELIVVRRLLGAWSR